MGHIEVPFKATGQDGSSELDKEQMAINQQKMEDHVRSNGIAGWFPEGRTNAGDTRQVDVFRAGGFSIPANNDVEIWCFAFQGNDVCWPRSAPAGGRPSRIMGKIFQFCESSKSFVTANCQSNEDDGGQAIRVLLANSTRDSIQAAVDEINAGSQCGRRSGATEGEEPLLNGGA